MFIQLDPDLSGPLYRQVFDSLRKAIIEGSLQSAARLPPTRELATTLNLSRNTINTAYEMLIAEGYIISKAGSGYFVNSELPDQLSQGTKQKAKSVYSSELHLSKRGNVIAEASRPVPKFKNPAFQPGLPDLELFPTHQWQQCLNHAVKISDKTLLHYSDQGGYQPLKIALQNYLQFSRGVHCAANQIIVVNGSQAGLDLITRLLVNENDNVAIEEPGYLGARDAFLASGSKLEFIDVGPEGISIKQLKRKRKKIKLVYTTPSYQFPLGVTMSLARRLELLNWAEKNQAYIIEDDYDSEFRFGDRPISSLQGLDKCNRVIYLGTLSKVMFPGLRLGFIVVPSHLSTAFANALRKTGQDSPLLWQAALEHFISSGFFASHIRRMRKIYAEKQSIVVQEIRNQADDFVEVKPTMAGMQLPVYFKKNMDLEKLLHQSQLEGFYLSSLSRYYSKPDSKEKTKKKNKVKEGLFLGYAGIPSGDIPKNITCLSRTLKNCEK